MKHAVKKLTHHISIILIRFVTQSAQVTKTPSLLGLVTTLVSHIQSNIFTVSNKYNYRPANRSLCFNSYIC